MLSYTLLKMVFEQLASYANHEYLRVLENQLRQIRLLYESGRIGEDAYRKAEAELTELIRNIRAQLKLQESRVREVSIL